MVPFLYSIIAEHKKKTVLYVKHSQCIAGSNSCTHLWLPPHPTMPVNSSFTIRVTLTLLPFIYTSCQDYCNCLSSVNLFSSLLPKSPLSHPPSLAHSPVLIINTSYTACKINSKVLGLAFRPLAATYRFSFILYLPPTQSSHGMANLKHGSFPFLHCSRPFPSSDSL